MTTLRMSVKGEISEDMKRRIRERVATAIVQEYIQGNGGKLEEIILIDKEAFQLEWEGHA